MIPSFRTPMLVLVAFGSALLVATIADARDDEKEKESPLHQQMEKIEHGLKRLRRDVKDPAKNVASLEILAGMEAALLESKLMTPPLTAKQPEAEREAFVRDYRKRLIAVGKDMLDLEIVLLDGDNTKAQELVKKIADAEDPGHEKFTEDG